MANYRILMIAPTSFFYDYGCHVRILEEARALRTRGHDVSICTYRKGRDIDGFAIHRTMPLPWRQDYEVGSSRHKLAYDVLLAPLVLNRTLSQRPDVIHAHMHEGTLIGGLIGRLLHIPVLFDFQGSMTSEMVDHHFLNPNGPWHKPLRGLERFIDHLPQAIITSSHNSADLLEQKYGCQHGRVTPVLDCVNTDVFRPNLLAAGERAALRESLGIPVQAPVVAYLGLLAEHQGTGLLLQAAAEVLRSWPGVYFLIMGFPLVEEYRAQAQALGIGAQAIFTGKMPYEQAPSHLALGDIAVAPKLSATEGAGKLLNYMAMAMPTVAFDTPVNREYLADLGLYPQEKTASSLAETILQALGNLPEQRRQAMALRERVRANFDWSNAVANIESIYAKLIGR